MAIDGGRQRQRGIGGELRGRHHLAARNAGKIGRDAFDVFDAADLEPVRGFLPGLYTSEGVEGGRYFRSFADFRCLLGSTSLGGHKSPVLASDSAS
ncbi:hypothetical protein D3C80_1830870 [compost metagenome]